MTTETKVYAQTTLESQQLANVLLGALKGIRESYPKFAYELESLQAELAELYHKIEITDLDHVSKSHKLMKKLQSILRRRRVVKQELENFSNLMNAVEVKELVSVLDDAVNTIQARTEGLQNYAGGQVEAWSKYFDKDHLRSVKREEIEEFSEKLESSVLKLDETLEKVFVTAEWHDPNKPPMRFSMKEALKELDSGRAIVVKYDTIKLLQKNRPVRDIVLERDGYSCTICSQPATTVVTKNPRNKGEVRTPDKCISVCEKCRKMLNINKQHQVVGKGE